METWPTFYVENFGCRATQADGAAIERQLRERGLERADEPAQAELVVLNTCTVTASADQDARAAIRRIHRKNPEARNCGDRLLRATRAGRNRGSARREPGHRQLA